ncbi:effector-associated domain EAD1-containing protein [Nostoc sp.]|uniref:effector-associated domain EAD1-containing protein n=1 Tax=Nostoc sp. TaxID=1180 RepID=UPI002FF6CE1E
MNLSGKQLNEVYEALIDAYPNKFALQQLLRFKLDKNLNAIAGEDTLQNIVYRLIETARSEGWLQDLVSKAYQYNSGNLLLKAVVQDLLIINTQVESSTQPVQQYKVLILAAIPEGLRLDLEMRKIREAIERGARHEVFKIEVRTAVRSQDIRRAIEEEKPQIVHVCGHGRKDGSLLLEDDGGNSIPVSPQGLASLFRLHMNYVKCVLLNTCYSEKSTIAISQYINYVIGMNNSIQDKAAIAFAQGFYDGLGYKTADTQDVFQRAFDEGMIAIEMEHSSQESIPFFKIKT